MTPTQMELPHAPGCRKMRYALFTFGGLEADLYLIPDKAPPRQWTFINRFASLADAREAVIRYINARYVAQSLWSRP